MTTYNQRPDWSGSSLTYYPHIRAIDTQDIDEPSIDAEGPLAVPRRTCQQCDRPYHRLLGDAHRCGLCLSDGAVASTASGKPLKPSICWDCHQSVPESLIYDRCTACLARWRAQLDPSRYAEPRPVRGHNPMGRPVLPPAACVVCQRVVHHRYIGRCPRCYRWWMAHGKQAERPLDLPERLAIGSCLGCAQTTHLHAKRRCARCYHQWRVQMQEQVG